MVRIEKLKLEDCVPEKKMFTLIDFLLDDHLSGEYAIFAKSNDVIPHTTLKQDIIETLSKKNIYLGDQYGKAGISISELITSNKHSDIIVEIPHYHIEFYNIDSLIQLSTTNKIIFTDIEEGFSAKTKWIDNSGVLRKDTFQNFLTFNNGFVTENIFTLSTNFENNSDCKEIKIYTFWILLTVLASKFSIELIEDFDKRKKYEEVLRSSEHKKFAIFKNWRARTHRILLLSLLHRSKLLDSGIDWSLVGNIPPMRNEENLASLVADGNSIPGLAKRRILHRNPKYKTELSNFFDDYTFPKFLDIDNVFNNKNSWIEIFEDDFNKYAYSITVESSTQITEKIVKDFLLGQMPIVLYPYDNCSYIERIQELGFYVLDESFDNKQTDLTLSTAHDLIKKLADAPIDINTDHLIENLNLCTDKKTLCNYICQPLIDTFK